jgi:hypothetical protein
MTRINDKAKENLSLLSKLTGMSETKLLDLAFGKLEGILEPDCRYVFDSVVSKEKEGNSRILILKFLICNFSKTVIFEQLTDAEQQEIAPLHMKTLDALAGQEFDRRDAEEKEKKIKAQYEKASEEVI